LVKPKNPEQFRWKDETSYAILYNIDDWFAWMKWNDGDLWKETRKEFDDEFETIWHPAQLHDLHRWMNEKESEWKLDVWQQREHCIVIFWEWPIDYNSSLPLLEQETSTLEQIRDLIINNS